jgi:hypothetical protein
MGCRLLGQVGPWLLQICSGMVEEKQQVFVFLINNNKKKEINNAYFFSTFFTFFIHANTSNIHIIGEREREISVYEYTG